jgi:hypothetical protein
MRNSPFWWILVSLMVIIDIYFFQVLKMLTASASQRARVIIHAGYWVFSSGAIILLFVLPYLQFNQSKVLRTTVFAVIAAVFFAKLVASLFFLIDDIRRGVQWLVGKFSARDYEVDKKADGENISRSLFLSWAGMIAGGSLFGTLIYGFGNKYKYQVKLVPLNFPNLPAAFRGLRIVQI